MVRDSVPHHTFVTHPTSVDTTVVESIHPVKEQPVEASVITEAKLREVAHSNAYHDVAFLKFLKGTKTSVAGDNQKYLRKVRELMDYFIVIPIQIDQAYYKEILMVSNSKIWHLTFDTLKSLKYSEMDVILEKIKNKNLNNMNLFDDLRNDQSLRLPEVFTNPRTIVYQYTTKPEDIKQLVIPKHLTP